MPGGDVTVVAGVDEVPQHHRQRGPRPRTQQVIRLREPKLAPCLVSPQLIFIQADFDFGPPPSERLRKPRVPLRPPPWGVPPLQPQHRGAYDVVVLHPVPAVADEGQRPQPAEQRVGLFLRAAHGGPEDVRVEAPGQRAGEGGPRRTGSCSHLRNRSTAVALGSPMSSGSVGRASASVDTSTGSPPVSRSTSSTTGSATTPCLRAAPAPRPR